MLDVPYRVQALELDLASAAWQHAQQQAGVKITGAEIVVVTPTSAPTLTLPPVLIGVEYEETVENHRAQLTVEAGSVWQAQPRGPVEVEIAGDWSYELADLTSNSVLSLTISGTEIEKFDLELREDVGEGSENWRFRPDALHDIVIIFRYTL